MCACLVDIVSCLVIRGVLVSIMDGRTSLLLCRLTSMTSGPTLAIVLELALSHHQKVGVDMNLNYVVQPTHLLASPLKLYTTSSFSHIYEAVSRRCTVISLTGLRALRYGAIVPRRTKRISMSFLFYVVVTQLPEAYFIISVKAFVGIF